MPQDASGVSSAEGVILKGALRFHLRMPAVRV